RAFDPVTVGDGPRAELAQIAAATALAAEDHGPGALRAPPQDQTAVGQVAAEGIVNGRDELSAGLGVQAVVEESAQCPDPAAGAVPRLEHLHIQTSPSEDAGGRKAGQTGPDDDDVGRLGWDSGGGHGDRILRNNGYSVAPRLPT